MKKILALKVGTVRLRQLITAKQQISLMFFECLLFKGNIKNLWKTYVSLSLSTLQHFFLSTYVK